MDESTAAGQATTYPDAPELPDPVVPSGWFRRLFAEIIDILVLLVPFAVALGLSSAIGAQDDDPSAGTQALGGALTAVGFCGAWAIILLTMDRGGLRNGQTPGKQLLGIRVIKRNRDSVDMDLAAGREFGCKAMLFDAIPFGVAAGVFAISEIAGGVCLAAAAILFLFNYLRPIWNDENLALHDSLAGTQVVRAK